MSQSAQRDLRPDVPHGARIWNYWLGGKDNYAADREVGDAVRAAWPGIALAAQQSRQYLVRTVRYLAGEAGITQFLDLGAGLPTMQNTHAVAQSVQPTARIVYVDNDPLVLAHARALLVNTSSQGHTAYLDADYHDTAAIADAVAADLDLNRPVALLCMGVFGYVPDSDEAHGIITGLMDLLAPGSHLALWDGTDTSEQARAGSAAQAEMGSPYQLRTVAELNGWFAGLDVVEPGVVPINRWRPDADDAAPIDDIDAWGGVARKP